ncbi:MAG: class I SAM-dependent methyltransferase [Sphingobacteriia bacterium]|nr:class I SAM-dependent methyltransferase [Sphingobacteriia bacterium]
MSNDQGKNYDKIAKDFDLARTKNLEKEKIYLDILTENLLEDSHILDLGCGTGEPIASYLIDKNFNVTGVDSSKELLKKAKENLTKLEIIFGDMRTIEFDKKFDVVIAWDSFFHLPHNDQELMIAKFSDWLKYSGRVVFTTGSENIEILNADMLGEKFSYYSFSPEEYNKLLEENNFNVILFEEDQPNHLVWIAEKY